MQPGQDVDTATSDVVGQGRSVDVDQLKDRRRRRPPRPSSRTTGQRWLIGGSGDGDDEHSSSISTTSTGFTTTSMLAIIGPSTRVPGRSVTSPARASVTRSLGERWTLSSYCVRSSRPTLLASLRTTQIRDAHVITVEIPRYRVNTHTSHVAEKLFQGEQMWAGQAKTSRIRR